MEAIRRFTADQFDDALESWSFLDLVGKRALFASPFGDVFLQDEHGIWFLDVLAADLTQLWTDQHALSDTLNTRDGQEQYLMIGLASELDAAGVRPGASQVYGFATPPALGGAIAADNVEVIDFAVAINLLGQIHNQIRNLPPGTPISGVTLN